MEHKYFPNTEETRARMLQDLELGSVEELFVHSIPENLRFKGDLDLPRGLSELELVGLLKSLAGKNIPVTKLISFLGGGVADHYIPAVIDHIMARSEFYTAYTPYQAEASQGTLQSIFEYQTMICMLTGMDAANASMYDGASSTAEAALLAAAATRRRDIVIGGTVNPQYRCTLKTYARAAGLKIIEVPPVNGQVDLNFLREAVGEHTAAVICQQPNYFGLLEDTFSIEKIAKQDDKTIYISIVEPISLGLLKPPAEYGCDIAVGEGQPLGNPLSFGGPHFGFFAVRKKFLRQLPGRIVGMTKDAIGNRGYVLTMQTREQHIRREKATSNICSNQALNALAATVYLSLLGKEGLGEVAEQCLYKANYLKERISRTNNYEIAFTGPTHKEFVVKSLRAPWQEIEAKMLSKGFLAGVPLEKDYPDLRGHFLVCVTEKRSKDELDAYVKELEAI